MALQVCIISLVSSTNAGYFVHLKLERKNTNSKSSFLSKSLYQLQLLTKSRVSHQEAMVSFVNIVKEDFRKTYAIVNQTNNTLSCL